MKINRKEVLVQLAKMVVLSPKFYRIAVFLSSLRDINVFHQEFKNLLSNVPAWLMPEISHEIVKCIEFENGRVDLCLSSMDIKGQSLTGIYVSSDFDQNKLNHLKDEVAPLLLNGAFMIEF